MSRWRIVPFDASHVAPAARLLARRHAEHRRREPLLADVDDFEQQVASELAEGSGVVAVSDPAPAGDANDAVDAVGGYLLGTRREDVLGPHIWSGLAGHAAVEPELVRDLYAAAAAEWVEAGLTRHFVFAPAMRSTVDPWFRLSFGASAWLAVRDLTALDNPGAGDGAPPHRTPDVIVRASTPDDLADIARLARSLDEHLAKAPSFGGRPVESLEQLRAEWADLWTEDTYVHFVAVRAADGAIVGHTLMYRRPAGDLRVGADNIDLGNAASDPSSRHQGVATAMTSHVIEWARAEGFRTMTTDWRATNLEASRFWPRCGFREAFVRLYRSIP